MFSSCTVTRFICWEARDPISGVYIIAFHNNKFNIVLLAVLWVTHAHYTCSSKVDLLYIFKVRSVSVMNVPGGTYFCGKALHEAPVSIFIRILAPAISIIAKIFFSGRLSSLTACTFPSWKESKDTDSNSSLEESSEMTMLTPLRGGLFLPEALLHIAANDLVYFMHFTPFQAWRDFFRGVFKRFNRSSLGSGRGCFCFWPLLRRFGGVFDFLRLSTALILFADVPVLDDCPLMTLTWALVASANGQISKHFSGDNLGSCNKFRRTLLSAIPQTRRSRIISFFNSHIYIYIYIYINHTLSLELAVLQSKHRLVPEVLVFNCWGCNVRRWHLSGQYNGTSIDSKQHLCLVFPHQSEKAGYCVLPAHRSQYKWWKSLSEIYFPFRLALWRFRMHPKLASISSSSRIDFLLNPAVLVEVHWS